MPDRCDHCRRNFSAGEPAFLSADKTRSVCRPCHETLDRNVIIRPELAHFGVTNETAARKKSDLTARLGRKVNRIEVIQALYDDLLANADNQKRKMLYIGLATEIHLSGLNPFPIKLEIARITLSGLTAKGVRIVATKGGCPACQALDGKFLTVEDALRTMPIPCRDCRFGITPTEPFGWCRCMYVAARR